MKNFKTAIKTGAILMILSAAFLIWGCEDEDPVNEVICTEEFLMIGVKVTGEELTDFYTLRVSTSDTIRFTNGDTYPLVNWYPILDDSYQPILEGTEEEFLFVGELDGSELLRETYVIGADQCHIFRQSGPQSIAL